MIEKLVKSRLDTHLEKYNLINIYQSGFRKHRKTLDNIIHFTEATCRARAIKSDNKVCGVVFDIAKAFDKIWQKGLVYKLHMIKLPHKLGFWIMNFLKNRKFIVKVDTKFPDLFNIETGVAQGSILSPIVFSIYINDVIEINKVTNEKVNCLLFTDDLFAFVMDSNVRRIVILMQRYLNELEKWLNKLRLCTAGHKCSCTFYLGNVPFLNKEHLSIEWL